MQKQSRKKNLQRMFSVWRSPKIFSKFIFHGTNSQNPSVEKRTSVNEANSLYLTTSVCVVRGKWWGVREGWTTGRGWAYDLYTRIGSVWKMEFGKLFLMAYSRVEIKLGEGREMLKEIPNSVVYELRRCVGMCSAYQKSYKN